MHLRFSYLNAISFLKFYSILFQWRSDCIFSIKIGLDWIGSVPLTGFCVSLSLYRTFKINNTLTAYDLFVYTYTV